MEKHIERRKYGETDFVLNFNDAVIYGSDLALLQSQSAWLNDACINFFLEWTKAQIPQDDPINFQCMDPAVTSFFVHQCVDSDEIEDFVSGLNLQDSPCKLFIPVNDTMVESTSWQSRRGNHWSLLVVAKQIESNVSFWHFDSITNSGNSIAVDTIARKLGKACFAMDLPIVIEADTPQQSNGYDCGVHVLEAIHIFTKISAMDLQTHVKELRRHVQDRPRFCQERRKAIAEEIFMLAG